MTRATKKLLKTPLLLIRDYVPKEGCECHLSTHKQVSFVYNIFLHLVRIQIGHIHMNAKSRRSEWIIRFIQSCQPLIQIGTGYAYCLAIIEGFALNYVSVGSAFGMFAEMHTDNFQ